MLKLNAGLSRKVGLPAYGSKGAMVNVEVELSADLLKDHERLRRQVRGIFGVIRETVDAELGVKPGGSGDDSQEERWRPVNGPRGSNGSSARNGSTTNGSMTNGRGSLPCTEKQVRALHAFSRKAGVELTEELRRRFGLTTAEELSRRQASEAIDRLKERVEQ
ncbi:hypothetical protein [Alienimonas californiensis]|uniref:Uncharacterized protein n=1 Tax=Alienimonas californiensis TaxID=2527989 RepID=A0A517PB84_9PLAN|nr:hypothetical protein [Alienimonas californiensis]QDT16636.1 hypothetical protein CA12_27420 [Alienimonas californiensis]